MRLNERHDKELTFSCNCEDIVVRKRSDHKIEIQFLFFRGLTTAEHHHQRPPPAFGPFSSAFRPVAKISDFLQLNHAAAAAAAAAANVNPNQQDSGEICEVSTTVGKDLDDNDKPAKLNSLDEVIDVETEENQAKKVKSEPQVSVIFPTKKQF